MKNYLYPRMHADHPDIALWTPTMNVADHTYFSPMLDDTSTHLTTACFQYEGRDAIAWAHTTYPKLKLRFTEMTCGGGDNQWSFAFDPSFKDLKYYIDNGAGGADWWNLILEKNGNSGPTVNFKQNSMITIDTVAKTFRYTPIYYVMKHFSFYIRPNSKIVKVTGSYAANQVSVKNVDGSVAVVAQNNSASAQTVTIKFGNQMVSASMPASSFGSFLMWDDAVSVSQPGIAGKSQSRIASVNRFYKVAGDKFSFPGEFEGKTCTGAIYDVDGRMVREFSVKAGAMSLSKDFGVSKGVYIVHVKAVRI
jgi:glucosylceramidase